MSLVNPNRRTLPGPSLLHELIAEANDDAIALEFLMADESLLTLTYGDFRTTSRSLSRLIRTSISKCPSPQVIPVIIAQCPELYIAWRAVLQAGASVCPISPDIPRERLKFILNDVSAKVVLCTKETESLIQAVADDLRCLSVALEALEESNEHDTDTTRPCNIESTSPAYVMYTSGSTGLPKGVQVSHAAVTQSLLAHDEHIPTFKRFLQFAAPTFDVSIFEIFFPFFRGATLVGRTREHMLADLPGTIIKLDADAAELTPTVASTLLRTRDAAPCLKLLLTIGEMLTKSVVAEFGGSEDRPSVLYAMYGPTEAAIHCTIAPRLSAAAPVRSIGVPFSTVTALVLQDRSNAESQSLAPVGVAGELAIAGQLADEYLNRPEQNQAAFIDLAHYGRVYLTGDRAICNPSGELEILGRISDGQVKLRGQRVELGEVEDVAARTEGISQTVAMVIKDSLVLFCTGSGTVNVAAVVATCKSWLPPFMRPSDVVLLDEAIPKLPSGKVDRKRLQLDYSERERAEAPVDSPRSPTEQAVAQVLERELERSFQRREDLWASGMDSLRAIKITSSLRHQFPSVTVQKVLTSDTLEGLAAAIAPRNEHAENGQIVSLVEDGVEWAKILETVKESVQLVTEARPVEVLPCTPIQIAMLAETEADLSMNFNRISLKRHGVTQERLWEAICSLARRTPLLRSGFVNTEDAQMPFVMVVWPELAHQPLSLLHPLQIATEKARRDCTTLCIHHALYDGWSWDLVLDDVNAILGSQTLLERPSFANVGRSIRARRSYATNEKAIEYWKSLLNGCEQTCIPCLVPTRPKKPSRQCNQRILRLSQRDLSTVSANLRIGRQAFIQACWALTLSACIDSRDVVFGTVVSGRHAPLDGIQEVIGPCLATVPTRLRLDRIKTIRDLLSYTQRQSLESLEYYETPLSEIKKVAGPGKGKDIFDSVVVWQEGPRRQSYERRFLDNVEAVDALNYTVALEVEPTNAGLRMKITTNTKFIDEQQSQLLAEQFDALLSSMVAQPDQQISGLSAALPTPLLSVANSDFKRFSATHGLSDTVAHWAQRTPDRIAIKFVHDFDVGGGQGRISNISYSSLHQKARNMMQKMVSHYGIGPDDLVCVHAPKSIELYIAILAVIMSGAGYMCIDPRTPKERVEHILAEADCALVITGSASGHYSGPARTVSIERLSVLPDHESRNGASNHSKASGRHLAYAVFTSGTTGVPKGVLMTRHNLASHLNYLTSNYPHEPAKDSLLQACSSAFDVSVFEIFWTWHVGMTLVAATNDVLFRDLGGFIHHFRVTHLSMTPSVAALIARDEVPKVKMLITAGEPMNQRVFQQWSGRGLFQGYGPSETTNICNVRRDVQFLDAPNNVGPVFSNTSAFVCRRLQQDSIPSTGLAIQHFELVPKGAVGEIWIGGDQVARGYIDPQMTRRAFFMHPEYGWLYRSGDIGRMLADDTMIILGRDDDQAKLRGQRIELGEINHILLQQSFITDAVTIIDDSQERPRLLSFVVLNQHTSIKEALSELFQYLEAALPSYMIADAIVPIEALPLTRQGKVDRIELLALLQTLPDEAPQICWRQSASDTDSGALEGVTMDIVQALSATLGISSSAIGLKTSFYQLGLDSLSAIKFSRELRRHDLPQIDVSTILRHGSIAALMYSLQHESNHMNGSAVARKRSSLDIGDTTRCRKDFAQSGLSLEKVLPCTDLQLSMLSASENSPRQSYRNRLIFRVHGDVRRLKQAWHKVWQRQRILRTAFIRNSSPSMPYLQVVVAQQQLKWSSEGVQPSEPSFATPKFEWYTLRVSSKNQRLYLTFDIHHALYDAVALDQLLYEVEATYHGISLGIPRPFDDYLEYAAGLDSGVIDSFWSKRLNHIRPCTLGDLLIPECYSINRNNRRVHMQTRLSSTELDDFIKAHTTTILALLQAVLARLLMQYHNQSSICFGTVFSGRNLPIEGADDIIGPCFNTLPSPAQAAGRASNIDLVRSLHNFNVDVLPFQPSSLRAIQQQNSSDGRPLFDTLILLQQDEHCLDDSIWELVDEEGEMDFPFILEISRQSGDDKLDVSLHSNLADENVLYRILKDFDELLHDTVCYPEGVAYRHGEIAKPDFLRTSSTISVNGLSQNGNHESDFDHDQLSSIEVQIKNILLALSPLKNRTVIRATTIFKLGLDSINAVQLASRLRELGYSVTSAQILQGPSLGEIAATCFRASAAPALDTVITAFPFEKFDKDYRASVCTKWSLRDEEVEAIRPCTPLQDGIIAQYLQSQGRLYYNTVKFQLNPGVHFPGLRQAWRKAAERHEMLRTGFVECDNDACNFAMIVHTAESAPLPDFLPKTPKTTMSTSDDLIREMVQPPWQLQWDEARHTLVMRMLHALYDAQSLDVILADVACHYLGQRSFATLQLLPTISSILSAAESDHSQQFWSKQENYVQATKFPNLHISNQSTNTFGVSEHEMTMTLTDAKQRCADLACTLQTACQAAWARILSAYTGQARVTFGLTLSGRNFGDNRDAAAFPCINTVPFTISTESGARKMLDKATAINVELLTNQHLPLTSIKRWQGLEDEAFDTILVFQKFESSLPEHVPWQVVDETATAEYSLSIEVLPDVQQDLLVLRLTFADSLVPREAARLILRQFDQELASILQHPRGGKTNHEPPTPSVLSPIEDRLTSEVSLLHELVERSAAMHPSDVALEFIESFHSEKPLLKTWTYRDLNHEGNRIANLLVSAGAQLGDLVATSFDKCAEASFAILGVLKAGCAYVAIDPGAPLDRKKFILQDAGCRILLTTSDKLADFDQETGIECWAVDDPNRLGGFSGDRPVLQQPVQPDSTCYCLYTSGTTGTPKGCLISHDSAVQAMISFTRIFKGHWNSDSRWLQFASFHFDVSVLEQYWSWSVGIRMTSAPRDLILEDLPTFLRLARVTHLDLTPSLARLISPEEVPSLCDGVFIVGGEQVSQDIIDTWGDAGCLYNFYGPSEVTIGCTVHPRVRRGTKPTNIGQLWDNVGARVLQPGTEAAVISGAVGELCLTGVLVGKGYLNRPELTAEKFAILEDGTRVYRTGDLVRLLHDDSFEFLGRTDDQVKLRGQRLEIGEINQVIKKASPVIAGVATMVLKHPGQGKEHLVAFLSTSKKHRNAAKTAIMNDGKTTELARKARQHCMDKLPGYMIPSEILVISSIPLSANNKVEMKVLKQLYMDSSSRGGRKHDQQVSLQPGDQDLFQRVSSIIAQRLQIPSESIRPDSRLFELGLDSVSAIGLTRALRSKGFANASIQVVMRIPVVLDLLYALKEESQDDIVQETKNAQRAIEQFANKHGDAICADLGLAADEVENISPCTPLQEGMLSKCLSSAEEDAVYFSSFEYELDDQIDIDQMVQSWRATAESTSILRTHFVPTVDGFAQVVALNEPTPIFVEQEPSQSGQDFAAWVRDVKQFSKTTPWRVSLVRCNRSVSMRLFIFHAVYDGIAMDLLLESVAKAYHTDQATQPRKSRFYEVLPHGPLALRSGAEAFWKGIIKDARLFDSPLTQAEYLTSTVSTLSSDHLQLPGLEKSCGKLNVTIPAVFHAAWLLCLAGKYNVNPTLGLVVSSRSVSHQDAESVIGPMFNTIPCTIGDLKPGSTMEDLATACHKFNVDALPYQHTPLRQIAKWLGIEPNKGLFDSLFVFQRERGDAYDHGLWHALPSQSTPDYPLNLEIEQRADGSFVFNLVGKAQYLSQEQCGELLSSLVQLLEQLDQSKLLPLPALFFSQPTETSLRGSNPRDVPDVIEDDVAWDPEHEKVRTEVSLLANVPAHHIGLRAPSIFELGLDSIDAMKLATRLKAAGIRVPISAIMRAPTVAGIAVAAKKSSRSSIQETESAFTKTTLSEAQSHYRDLVQATGIDPVDFEVILPVTAMQEGLLLAYEKYYNIMPLAVSPETDLDILERAWQETAATHDILRTHFVMCENDTGDALLLQAVMRTPQLEIEHVRAHDTGSAMSALSQEATERGFSMPAVKIVFFEQNGRTLLLLGMPHAAYDGWSMQLLHQEVARMYHKLSGADQKDSSTDIQPPKEHLEAVLREAEAPETRASWQEAAQHAMPTLFSLGAEPNEQRPPQLLQEASATSTTATERFCQQAGVTMQSLGLAVWSCYLARHISSPSICFGLVLAGRTTEGSDRLIFPTFNTVLFSTKISPALSAKQLVQDTHAHALNVAEHQHFPLKETLRLTRLHRGQSEVFNTLFTYQKGPGNDAGGFELYHDVEVEETSINPPYAVNVELEVKQGQLLWTIASQKGVFTPTEAEQAIRDLDQLLARMINAPDDSVFSGDEQRKLRSSGAVATVESKHVSAGVTLDFTSNEAIVRDVLAEISKTTAAHITKTTNIFNLGLDSISAIKLSSTLRKRGLKIPISKIIETQTVEKMSAAATPFSSLPNELEVPIQSATHPLVQDLQPYLALLGSNGLRKDAIEAILPATAGQEYMLSLWRASKGALFVATFWLEVSSDISTSAFNEAVEKLVATQPMLRTTFFSTPQGVVQIRLTPRAASGRVVGLPWSVGVERRRASDGAGEGNLFVTLRIHHALYDAVSLDLLLAQLGRLCQGVPAAAQNDGYSGFIDATHSFTEERKGQHREFWRRYLSAATRSLGTSTRQGGDGHKFGGKRIELFRPQLCPAAALLERARREGVSVQALFFATVGRVHAATTSAGPMPQPRTESGTNNGPRSECVVIGIYLSNRTVDILGLTTLAAPTLNVVPLCIDVSPEVGMWEAARKVQRDLGEIGKQDNCGVNLREVWEWTGVTLECVVNWVSIPDNSEDIGKAQAVWHAGEEVRREMGATKGDDGVNESITPFMTDGGDGAHGETSEDGEMQWVIPSVDVEAKIEDGHLAMGLFGQGSQLGAEDGFGLETWFGAVKAGLAAAVAGE